MGSEIEIGFALVMEAFDKFDQAAGRIITAQPAQMTQAAANLEHAREGARAATIIALSGFIKKTQKTPDEELALARKRMKEFTS